MNFSQEKNYSPPWIPPLPSFSLTQFVQTSGCLVSNNFPSFCSLQLPAERRYCEVCQAHYSEDTVALHERSTAHLFNRCDPLPSTRYCIPENNVGFQLMVKGGWDKETGLGPSGAGRKFPIKTVLKRDQKGLGFCSNLKPKVTHFRPNDRCAVEEPVKRQSRKERAATVGKREARRREAKAAAWERNLRAYMNFDL